MREKLRTNQPIAYQILKNSLMSDSYAHAYLFYGDKGCGKMDTAIFLAQSLMCEHEGFACEECDICHRVKNNNYTDLLIIDGSIKTIKKEDILNIQEEFSKTAFEAAQKKVYILNLIENATVDALNSLLKFLEEPQSDVIAILITESIDQILPTIISRCQRIPFKKVSFEECFNSAKNLGIDEMDAYLCASLVNDPDEILHLSEDENYQSARYLAIEFLSHFYDDPYQSILDMEVFGFDKKGNDRIQFIFFTDILMRFYRDVIQGNSPCLNQTWQKNLKNYSIEKSIQYLSICMKYKDMCTKSVNIKMLTDSMLIQIKEVS